MTKALPQHSRALRRLPLPTLAVTNAPRRFAEGNSSGPWEFPPQETCGANSKRRTVAHGYRAIVKSKKSLRWTSVLIGPLLTAAALIAATATVGRPVGGPLASTSGAVAAAITILFPWPQLLRSIRLGTAAGVSGASWLMMFFAISGWALYGIEHSDRYQQISSALTLPAVCGVLCVIHRSQGISVKHAGYTMAATGLGVLTVAFGGGIGSAVVVLGTSLLIGFTALSSVLSSKVPIGFSAASLNISSLAQVAWLMHAFLSDKWVVAVHAVAVIVLNSFVIFCAKRQMRRRKRRSGFEDRCHVHTSNFLTNF